MPLFRIEVDSADAGELGPLTVTLTAENEADAGERIFAVAKAVSACHFSLELVQITRQETRSRVPAGSGDQARDVMRAKARQKGTIRPIR